MRRPQIIAALLSVLVGSNLRSGDMLAAETSVYQDSATADTSPQHFAFDDLAVDGSPVDAVGIDNRVTLATNSIPLSPARPTRDRNSNPIKFSMASKNFRQVASALSVVIGIFLLFVVFNRAVVRRKSAPHEIIEVLGRTAVTPKHNLHLIRVHNRLILLAETPQGLQQLETLPNPNVESAEPLSQSTGSTSLHDPEAQRLLDLIRRNDGWNSTDQVPERLRDTSYVG